MIIYEHVLNFITFMKRDYFKCEKETKNTKRFFFNIDSPYRCEVSSFSFWICPSQLNRKAVSLKLEHAFCFIEIHSLFK